MQNWPGHKIDYELRKAGYRQADVARATGRSSAMVHQVIYDEKVSEPIRAKIAEFIGVDIKIIWAAYYFPNTCVKAAG